MPPCAPRIDLLVLGAALALVACGPAGESGPTDSQPAPTNTDSPSDTDSSSSTETHTDCADEEVIDWYGVNPGPHPVGWRTHSATTSLAGHAYERPFAIYYPALLDGEAAEVDVDNGPRPTVFFQHAGGSHYLDYKTVFSHLASHGFVVVSIDHNDIDDSTGRRQDTWWYAHALAYLETLDEVIHWSRQPSHTYEGLVDTTRLGLAGHSHGSALLALQSLGPVDTTAEHTVQAVSLLAPCPDEEPDDYLKAYSGTPPLQVIYGSRDQDGCVAHGQSIAVFEVGARPRQFVHLVGGSHYGFTDTGSLQDATISRADHQAVAAAGMLAWWRYHLRGDRTALPVLRGDIDLVPFGPEVRIQFLDAQPFIVDDFTPDEEDTRAWMDVPAITGLPGQTFINGFLSDAFADPQAGTALVRAEVEALLDAEPVAGPAANVLYFLDTVLGEDTYALALDELENEAAVASVRVRNRDLFESLLASEEWALVIAATQGGGATDEHDSDEALADWICGGGKTIVSDYRMESQGANGLLDCSNTGFHDSDNYATLTSTGDLFEGSLALLNPGWGYYAVGLETEEATVFATASVPGLRLSPDPLNVLGLAVETQGLSQVAHRWMHDEVDGLHHPNWGLELSWSEPGGSLRQVVGHSEAGLDLRDRPVLTFRVASLDASPLNRGDEPQDLHLRLTDVAGRSGTILLSQAHQGALRPAAEVANGGPPKSVYETYRLPLTLFLSDEPELDLGRVATVEWVFDMTNSGSLALDDVAFTGAGTCE